MNPLPRELRKKLVRDEDRTNTIDETKRTCSYCLLCFKEHADFHEHFRSCPVRFDLRSVQVQRDLRPLIDKYGYHEVAKALKSARA